MIIEQKCGFQECYRKLSFEWYLALATHNLMMSSDVYQERDSTYYGQVRIHTFIVGPFACVLMIFVRLKDTPRNLLQ